MKSSSKVTPLVLPAVSIVPFDSLSNSPLRKSKDLMEKFYSDKVELDDLAKAAFMSRFHYVRIFKSMYGLTPRAYLRDLRISRAKVLIKQGLPITQVCFDVGYESATTFSSVFKKCKSYTPSEYQGLHNSNLE